MLRAVCALLAGEALILFGLWVAWPPLAYIAAGAQLMALALTREAGGKQ